MLQLLPYSVDKYIKWTLTCLAFFLCTVATSQSPLRFSSNGQTQNNIAYYRDKSSIKSIIKSIGKDAVFSIDDKRIGYTIRLENNLKENQFGTVVTQISNSNGIPLFKDVHNFDIRKRGVYEKDFLFDGKQLQPGFYISNISIVTNKYADTLAYTFAYEPEKVFIKNNPPKDLASFWEQAKKELAAVSPNFNVTPRPDLNNKFSDAYEIQFNSTNNAVIYGWLTIPKAGKRNALLYNISDYMSELKPEYRRDLAVLSINTRGTGASNTNYNYSYYDLGLLNIKDKNKYVLKGIVLDALRGLDFINTFSGKLGIDNNKIIINGSGLAASISVVVAALHPTLKGICLESPSFIDMRSMINFNEGVMNSGFPAAMFKNYYYNKKGIKESMLNTLDYFDPVYFAPYVNCSVLVGFGLKNINSPASCVYNFINQLRVQKKDKYVCKNCDAPLDKGFYGFKEAWIKEKLGQP